MLLFCYSFLCFLEEFLLPLQNEVRQEVVQVIVQHNV